MRSVGIFVMVVGLLAAPRGVPAQETGAPAGGSSEATPSASLDGKKAAASERVASWLALIDGRDYKTSWDRSSPFLRKHYEKSHWVRAMEVSLTPLGDVQSRTLRDVEHYTQMPSGPARDYLIFRYDTVYQHLAAAQESITMMWVPEESRWRVAGYFIK